MIQLSDVKPDTVYEIQLKELFEGAEKGVITLTGTDLKKLILILNLSIGNLPDNAPDITGLVDQITKGIGFQK